ncbi:MAG: endonuclease/exonuclease/phosphatase family protein [Roseibium sp.]|uniref:endonuclease/exonuclease/phosphatase family protein n=1 Tax=Roseibium sp. TaxID=1936156 RepID=UPI0026179124|nr:endonuclease/exonuclease/phosphatase family protein [Roseibium sp.]MCV0424507.1 endonuclease/exonuclease/phosphatase family protein [Roseibium sp.]
MPFDTPRNRRSLLVTLFSFICWCGCLGALAVSIMGLSTFFAPEFWLADNMSFFLRQFLAGGLAGCIAGGLGFLVSHRMARLYKVLFTLALSALFALAGLTAVRTLENTAELTSLSEDATSIKVISINIEHLFLGDEILQAYLAKENPDIIVIQEVLWWLQERRWRRLGLPVGENGNGVFPEHLKVGELGNLAVYSRFPVLSDKTNIIEGELPPGANVYYDADRELLSLTLDTGKHPLHLLAIHPDSPRTRARWLNKRHYFDQVDETIQQLQAQNDGPVLAIGDWNSSPWSARFQRTLSESNLKTAYPGGWPRTTRFFFDYRLHWILGAPVDQFAVSKDIQVASVSLGPDIGSDHLPLVIEIELE